MASIDITSAVEGGPEVGSPAWYLETLSAELDVRRVLVNLYEDYYEGRHSLAFVPSRLRAAMGAMLASVGDNYMPLVVQSAVERISVQGFSLAGSDDVAGDRDAWEIWAGSDLVEHEAQLWTEACKHGEAYLLVWAGEGDGPARITLEHPGQMAVARHAEDRNRVVAALKRWRTDWGDEFATLYMPGRVYRYRRARARDVAEVLSLGGVDGGWEPRELDGVPAESSMPASVGVPVVPVVNEPTMLPSRTGTALQSWPHLIPPAAHIGLGRSDMADMIGTQDSLNGTLVDAHSVSRYQGFALRYAIGVEVPRDAAGNQVPLDTSPGALLMLDYDKDVDPEPKIGQLQSSNLGQCIDLVVQRVQSLSSRARVPVHYLLSGRVALPSGESLRAAEAGLVSKVAAKHRPFGGAASRAVRIGFAWQGDSRAGLRFQTQWAPHEYRTESEHADAVVKRVAGLGVPREQGWRDADYSPDDISRMREMRKAELLEAATQQVLAARDFGSPPADPPRIELPTGVTA